MSLRPRTPSTPVAAPAPRSRLDEVLGVGLSLGALGLKPDSTPIVPTNLALLQLCPTSAPKRKLDDDVSDLPLLLVRSLVSVVLNWATQKTRFWRQLHKETMQYTVDRNTQGGFDVRLRFRRARSADDASSERQITISLPPPFAAPPKPLSMAVDQNTYESLERAILKHVTKQRYQGTTQDDLESFGPEVMELLRHVLDAKDSPWQGLPIQNPKIRMHADASTASPKWHNDAANPDTDEIVTFYVRNNPANAPLADENMPRIVRGDVPWVDHVQIAVTLLRAVGFDVDGDTILANGGPSESLASAYHRFIDDGINSGHFAVDPWPKRSFVRVSGTFHIGPKPFRKQKGGLERDPRNGRVFIVFRTGRTVAESMNPASG